MPGPPCRQRVGIGTAWHMWLTAPAFYFLERSFIGLHPGVTWWAQIPPLVAGIAAIPAIYFLARHFGFGRAVGLILALLVCVSPVCVVYSTRLKEYGTVFLMTCVMLWVAETARRQPTRDPVGPAGDGVSPGIRGVGVDGSGDRGCVDRPGDRRNPGSADSGATRC